MHGMRDAQNTGIRCGSDGRQYGKGAFDEILIPNPQSILRLDSQLL
jgi:hypothetical protein